MINKENIKVIYKEDAAYPNRLKQIKNPPKKLYVIGNLPNENLPTVGIVGARSASEYGLSLAKSIARTLSRNNIQIISGLALGIDSAGHLGALEAEKPNFAVMGNGVNICYPSYNYNIYTKILELNGGIISEYPNDTEPLPSYFPSRNRIIAGLSDILIVVEGKKNSGSLITANHMLTNGKDLFACPGRVGDILAEGPNDLIKQGAYIFTSINDIFDYFGIKNKKEIPLNKIKQKNLDFCENRIYEVLTNESMHIDDIVDKVGLPLDKVLNSLMSLQIDGLVEQSNIGYYKLYKF